VLIDWRPKSFRVFDGWFELEGYKDVIKQVWERQVYSGNSLENVKIKLKGLRQAFKQWREEGVNSEREKKEKILEEIEDLDNLYDEGNLKEDMRVMRMGLLGELKRMSETEIIMMKQKSHL